MINPIDEARELLSDLVAKAYKKATEEGVLPAADFEKPAAETPKDRRNGDVSSNFALVMAGRLKAPPRKIASEIVSRLDLSDTYFENIEIAGAGFINVSFSPAWYSGVLEAVESMGGRYGSQNIGSGKRVNVEFVSANTTGPMHLGNARGGVLGDSLAEVLSRAGYEVTREFYVNDTGNQVGLFALSLEARYIQHFRGEDACAFPEDGYHGDDIRELAEKFASIHGDKYLETDEKTRREALAAFGLSHNIARMKSDLLRYKVTYDNWYMESSLHGSGYVDETIALLRSRNCLYEKDGALWFRAGDFGAEKDEVLKRSNGYYTYYAADIAYHRDKLEKRGFDRAIDVLGADHHGHTLRFRAGLSAVGIDPERLGFVLMQLVRLMRDGETVRMSKRTGKAITLSNLLDEISVDAARFFFNSRQPDTHLEFDLGLAVRQESDNPVYYVQYAHARICSMLALLLSDGAALPPLPELDVTLLSSEEEKAVIRSLASLPEEIRLAARDCEPSRLTRYLIELASAFHTFYTAHRIKDAEPALMQARLKLADSVRSVLANVLGMLKISAPEKM